MENLLSKYPFLNVEFVEAIDGNLLSKTQKEKLFDCDAAFKLYGKHLSDGEIGCTLSHQLCYKKILNDKNDFALILEDDLLIKEVDIEAILQNIIQVKGERALVVLLSGDYYWIKKKKLFSSYSLATVYDASCTQAYIVNRKAAAALANKRPHFLADDWVLFKRKVDLRAVYPHLMDQNRADFDSEVKANQIGIIKKHLSVKRNILFFIIGLVKKILIWSKHFEKKSFKY
jgi:glycoside transferase family 25